MIANVESAASLFAIDDMTSASNSELANVTSVQSADGKVLTCRYLNSPYFDFNADISRCLHKMFVIVGQEYQATHLYRLRMAVELLLEFIARLNIRNPVQLRITKYSDINSEVFTGFIDFIERESHSKACLVAFKSGMNKAANAGILPHLKLPGVNTQQEKTKPLYKDGFESLQAACTSHIKKAYEILAFRERVQDSEPYIASEVMEEIRPAATRERLLDWHKHVEVMNRGSKRSTYFHRFSKCPDPEIRALATDPHGVEKFKEIYHRERDTITFDGLTDPFEKAATKWIPDYARVVKTFLTHGYPLNNSFEETINKYEHSKLGKLEDNCSDIIFIILHRISKVNQATAKIRVLTTDEILGLYYPTAEHMAALITFMMFQSGWNKETVLSIDQDNYEHVLTGAIEEAIKVVYSEKNRSQNNGLPFEKPKRIHLPSRSDDPISFYSLVGLCQHLSDPFTPHSLDFVSTQIDEEKMNPLFFCIRNKQDWSRAGRFTSIAYLPAFAVGVRNLLKMYEVIDNGKRLTSAKELTSRLRPTWLLHKKKHNPISLLSATMGHSDRDTTDIFYDNSGAARLERMQRLRSELEDIIKLLRARQFKGLLSKHAQLEASAQMKIFHIPGHDRPLWACGNQNKPDWVGSEIIATTGMKCFSIAECIFCSQMRVFQDSLPFLIERAAHLQEIIDERDLDGISFDSRFIKELEAIQYILDKWGDDDDIKLAARYRRRRTPLLPRDLKILEIVFESEDYNI